MTSPTLAADSYKSADAVSLKTQRNAGSAAAGFGATGGVIGALLGTAVAGTMTGVEGSNFRSKHSDILSRLDAQMKPPVSGDLAAAYTETLKRDSFFATKLRPGSPNRFEVEVLGYGLSRVAGEEEDMFTPFLNTAVTLKTASGSTLMKRVPVWANATMDGGKGQPLHLLAQDKKLMQTEWQRAVRANARVFGEKLKERHEE